MTPKIVDIPITMERYYGKGKMLHPTMDIVAEAVKAIPFGAVTTIEMLCNKLAMEHHTAVTCPMRTGNFIKKMATNETVNEIPYWRVLKKDGWLINVDNIAENAAKLEAEGFTFKYAKDNKIQVVDYKQRLFEFIND